MVMTVGMVYDRFTHYAYFITMNLQQFSARYHPLVIGVVTASKYTLWL